MKLAEATSHPVPQGAGGLRGRNLAGAFGFLLDHLEEFGLGTLLLAAAFPAAPPTAAGFADPNYTNLWSSRLGGGNLFELTFIAFGVGWLVRAIVAPTRSTGFDRPLLALVLCLAGLNAVALTGSGGEVSYLAADLERLVLLAAGYLIVTRSVRDLAALRTFTLLLAGVICLRAIQLIFAYGLNGETEFTTILGRTALLITEDGFLLMLPVALAWGALSTAASPSGARSRWCSERRPCSS